MQFHSVNFAEGTSKIIWFQVANVLQDPEICDTIFIVGDGIERQEIRAEPACENKGREINNMQPKMFRQILD